MTTADQDLPTVPSPYQGETLTVRQHLKISAYWFATNFHWGALLVIMLPAEIMRLLPEQRVMALGLLTSLSAIIALVVPLVIGALSDRCASRVGRRRPYITVGVGINLLGLAEMYVAYRIGISKPLPDIGHAGYWETIGALLGHMPFVAYLLSLYALRGDRDRELHVHARVLRGVHRGHCC